MDGSLQIAGRRLAWTTHGTGRPLLLVNGYAASGADWDPTLIACLAESFTVICPDNRGTGHSEPGAEVLTIDGMAADLEALVGHLGIASLPVVGWSMGGFIAQRLALRAPSVVAGLGLLSTDPGGGAIAAEAGIWARLTDSSGTPREAATRLISLLFPPTLAPQIDAQVGDIVAAAKATLDPAVLRAQEQAMTAWHAAEQPRPDGPPPVLVAHGEEDVVIPAANAALLAERWSAGPAEIFAGGGHGFMAQEPKRLAGLLTGAFAPAQGTRA